MKHNVDASQVFVIQLCTDMVVTVQSALSIPVTPDGLAQGHSASAFCFAALGHTSQFPPCTDNACMQAPHARAIPQPAQKYCLHKCNGIPFTINYIAFGKKSNAVQTCRAGASNLPRDEGNAVLPSQAGDSQLIRLPGQTRVSPEEYKEFLGLGHGDVFDLDPDRFHPPLLCMHDIRVRGIKQLPTAQGGFEERWGCPCLGVCTSALWC